MCAVDEVEIIVAHQARATLRVGDVFLKVDPDEEGIDAEVEALALAPLPTPKVLWRQPPVLAISAVPGTALGRLGEPSPHRARHGSPGARPGAPDALPRRRRQNSSPGVATVRRHDRRLRRAPALGSTSSCTATCRSATSSSTATRSRCWSGAGRGRPDRPRRPHLWAARNTSGRHRLRYGDGFDLDTVSGWWSFRCLEGDPLVGRAWVRPTSGRGRTYGPSSRAPPFGMRWSYECVPSSRHLTHASSTAAVNERGPRRTRPR